MSKFKIATLLAASLLAIGQAQGATTDTVQSPTDFFVPTDAQKFDSPYYREYDEDWSWTHNAIAGTITTASLNISAFDVDAGASDPEVDEIYAKDDGTWVLLGSLDGADDTWAFTNFALGANFFNDINNGLEVMIDIDTTHNSTFWLVTLAKSSLTVDGGALPSPVPGIPEPGTYAMMLAGLAAVGSIAKRRQQK